MQVIRLGFIFLVVSSRGFGCSHQGDARTDKRRRKCQTGKEISLASDALMIKSLINRALLNSHPENHFLYRHAGSRLNIISPPFSVVLPENKASEGQMYVFTTCMYLACSVCDS